MSIIINIPSLKKPERCLDCPLLRHIEEDYYHFDHYECVIENWSDINIQNTPISFEEAYGKVVLDSCPVGNYPIKSNKEKEEFELIEDYYNE